MYKVRLQRAIPALMRTMQACTWEAPARIRVHKAQDTYVEVPQSLSSTRAEPASGLHTQAPGQASQRLQQLVGLAATSLQRPLSARWAGSGGARAGLGWKQGGVSPAIEENSSATVRCRLPASVSIVHQSPCYWGAAGAWPWPWPWPLLLLAPA